jgi:ABC-type polysaccharide/polyol phosphate export permease
MVKRIIRELLLFVKEMIDKKDIISAIVVKNIKSRHSTSYLGIFWLYCQPIMYMGILYFVFTIGLRSGNLEGIPFIVYLTSGIIPWFYFTDCFGNSSNLIKKHGYLVKKVDFRLSILPVVSLIENAITHLVLVIFAILIVIVKGLPLTLFIFQILYYFFAMFMLLFGLTLLVSSINLFVSDIGNIVTIFIQFGFWFTPIFWDIKLIPYSYQWLLVSNPMYYIVSGYRDSIIFNIPFWNRPLISLYFWSVTIILCLLGAIVFRKLRPHFAEVI